MNYKFLFSICLAGASLTAFAQTHKEGVEYYKADQIENARELLNRNINNSGTDKGISNYYLGLIALQDGNKAEAQRYFNSGINANPEYGYNYVGLGSLDLLNGDTKAAEKNFKEAESLCKKDAMVHVAIARAYYNADPVVYSKEIDKRLEKARKTQLSEPGIYLFEGDMLKDQKDWGGAAAKYEMAANYDSNAAEAYVKYANLFTQVNPQYAITMLKRLLELNPTSALGQRELANAYYNNKDYSNAVKEYSKYVANPNHFKQDEDRYSFLLFYGGDYKKGYDYATNLISNNPDNFTARRYQFMNAANLPEMKENLLPMAESLYAAHKSNSQNKFAAIDYILIAEELQSAKRTDEAVTVLKEAIADMPENAAFNKQLAMVYVDSNDLVSAAKSYKGYLEKSEKPSYNDYIQQSVFSFYAGVQSKGNGESNYMTYFDESKEYASKASEILPDNYKPSKIRGDIAKQLASKDNVGSAAVSMYTQAVELLEASSDPSKYASDAKDMYNYLGNYYLDQKNTAKAKEYFNKYLKYDPNNSDYRKFVDNLK